MTALADTARPRPLDRLAARLGVADRTVLLWLVAVYAAFCAVTLFLVTRDTVFGQDYRYHMDLTLRAIEDPRSLFWFDKTNPPLLYVVGMAMYALFGDPGFVYASGVLFIPLGVVGLHLLFLIGRRLGAGERVAALYVAFAAFLPLTTITTVVYASDTLTVVPLLGFVLAVLRFTEGTGRAERTSRLGLAGLAIAFGALAKYTFAAFAAIAPATLAVLALFRKIGRRDLPAYLLLVVILPGALIGAIRMENSRYHLHGTTFPRPAGAMTIESLLLPKWNDLYLLTGPSPGEPLIVDGKPAMVDHHGRIVEKDGLPGYRMLVNNAHSYPGLLHLGIYTDLLDLADRGLLDAWGERDATTQAFQTASVNLGLVFSVLLPVGLAGAAVRCGRTLVALARGRRRPEDLALLVLFGGALGLFLPVAGMLPFMAMPYYMGYWLPRLVYAPILAFGLIAFVTFGRALEALRWRRPGLERGLRRAWIAAVVLQSALGLGAVIAPAF